MHKKNIIAGFLLGLFFILGCATRQTVESAAEKEEFDGKFTDRPIEPSQEEEISITEKGVKYLIHPSKILGGGPPKDGIPSIDNPKFVSVAKSDEWIEDNELVMAIIYRGVKRVYPLQILVWHEIVNDHRSTKPEYRAYKTVWQRSVWELL